MRRFNHSLSVLKEVDPLFYAAHVYSMQTLMKEVNLHNVRNNQIENFKAVLQELMQKEEIQLPVFETLNYQDDIVTWRKSENLGEITHRCEVCYDEIATGQITNTCISNLFYCYLCTTDYLRHKILEANIDSSGCIKCLCQLSNCNFLYNRDNIVDRFVGNVEILDKYNEFATNAYVMASGDGVFCPHPNCGAMVKLAANGPKIVKCPSCNKQFCSKCKNAHSMFTSCSMAVDPEFAKWKYHTEQGCKRCPACRTFIEKNEGCPHMTCAKCRHEFCWNCKSDWSGGCSSRLCVVKGVLKHRYWGKSPPTRAARKILGVPVLAVAGVGGIGLGLGAVAVAGGLAIGVGLGAASVALPSFGVYHAYKRYQEHQTSGLQIQILDDADMVRQGVNVLLGVHFNNPDFIQFYEESVTSPNPTMFGMRGRWEGRIFVGYSPTFTFRGHAVSTILYMIPSLNQENEFLEGDEDISHNLREHLKTVRNQVNLHDMGLYFSDAVDPCVSLEDMLPQCLEFISGRLSLI